MLYVDQLVAVRPIAVPSATSNKCSGDRDKKLVVVGFAHVGQSAFERRHTTKPSQVMVD